MNKALAALLRIFLWLAVFIPIGVLAFYLNIPKIIAVAVIFAIWIPLNNKLNSLIKSRGRKLY